jgi:hypothetical protein
MLYHWRGNSRDDKSTFSDIGNNPSLYQGFSGVKAGGRLHHVYLSQLHDGE